MERNWKQVVRDTAEKGRKKAFGTVPDFIKDSPIWLVWNKKYTPKQIMAMLELSEMPWEKKMEQIAIGDPMERLGKGFEEVLRGQTNAEE